LALNGGTMTGALTLNADPTAALQAATKEYVDGLTGAPNKLVNPFMEIDQANEGAVTTNGGYIIDGWAAAAAGGGFSISQQRVTDAPPGYPNSIRLTVATASPVVAGSVYVLIGRLEGDDIADTGFGTANAKTLALSFWIKASVAGLYSGALRNAANTRSYVFSYSVTSANVWQQFNQVIPGDQGGAWVNSGNAIGWELDFCPGSGSTYQTATLNAWQAGNFVAATTALNTFTNTAGATFQLGPCGLWVASAPQPLLRTSIYAELARCQRYYEKSYDLGTAIGTVTTAGAPEFVAQTGQGGQTPIPFKVTKRVIPTINMYSTTTGASGVLHNYGTGTDVAASASAPGTNGIAALASAANATAAALYSAHWTADARL
jgi:hypothetical protein